MGRLIDADELLKAMDTWDKFGFEHTGCFVREPKDDFVTYVHYEDMLKSVNGMPTVEARLKADMVDMLEEIESMFWELTKNKYDMQILYEKADNFEADFNSFIQQKINSLKEATDGKNR